ncbi:hypothetical protein [Bacillus pinisoli]|nr:hypothetical protein [Bacillus pinisoli]
MLNLSAGVTGFQPSPLIDGIEFNSICYSLFGSNVLVFNMN